MYKLYKNNELRSIILEGCFVLLLALALGHGGPYGTYERFTLIERLGLWVLVIMVPWAMTKCFFVLAKKFAPADTSSTLLIVLLIPFLALIGSAFTTQINLKVGLITERTFFEAWPYAILTWLIFAYIIVLPMTLIGSSIAKESRKSGVMNMMEFFHQKLPDSIQGKQLLALKAEDHYLKVITDGGSALILMKFEDALSVLNGYPGIQTHRSWWVASSQLNGLPSMPASTTYVTLQNGEQAPISRRRRKEVNAYASERSEAIE